MADVDRFKYAKARQKIIDALRMDLLGPRDENEVLDERPDTAYILGILEPKTESLNSVEMNDEDVEMDMNVEDNHDYSSNDEDDNEPVSNTHIAMPSSIGISFYVSSDTSEFNIDISWGDYVTSTNTIVDKDGKERNKSTFVRQPMKETIVVKQNEINKNKDIPLKIDSNVHLYLSRLLMKQGYSLITAYVVNKRTNSEDKLASSMFQVKVRAYSGSNEPIFIAEHVCRRVINKDEFYYETRPIFGRGRGCAAVWNKTDEDRISSIESDYIPQYEYAGVDSKLYGFDSKYFSTKNMALPRFKNETIEKLEALASSYEEWIDRTLEKDSKMSNPVFIDEVGKLTIQECHNSLRRIKEGIDLIKSDELAFDAFAFMNSTIYMQNAIKRYSIQHGKGIKCSFDDFLTFKNPDNDFAWRPFQIAFILMNLSDIVHPEHNDRNIVDLLYFPTGGGKTEAYLGLMAFTIANRRLRNNESDEYNRDGGVTAILRYTLRLLTTQQRDRITKMVVAADWVREKACPKYGKEPITIGFWVGGSVTPNKFEELEENSRNTSGDVARKKRLIYRQVLNCPFCGKPLVNKKGEPLSRDTFQIDVQKKSVEIYCEDEHCLYYKFGRKDAKTQRLLPPKRIPVYLVDEEIYNKCPTIILSTVDKFARLPWDVKTNALFGRVDRLNSRDGYVAIGDKTTSYRKTDHFPAANITEIKPFLPPELIIQDELHLITGPLGTIYGAYETIIDEMCTYKVGDKTIKPKYVVSTATIKNASEQTKCLYARKNTSQFPPNGFSIEDSFFIREVPTETNPFRMYVGISAPGKSVKTTLLRTYASILQTSYYMSLQDEWKDVIDPYYSLVGYYNSIRELGGAVRLLQDDIPKRIRRIAKLNGQEKQRFLNHKEEITSRMSSYDIPRKLSMLEVDYTSKDCLDTAVATNMIAVGMDVDRLGLMVVTGQPKQNSEYIQATSRIGRSLPGLVVTVYNPYRPRDLSHYENFTGYHSQLYRFVEGTTATPFSARARDRVLHALVISAIRLKFPEFADNDGAGRINDLTEEQLNEVKNIIFEHLKIVKPSARADAKKEIDDFISWWKYLSSQNQPLKYYIYNTNKQYLRLMNYYDQICTETEKKTLGSMRDVENSSSIYYFSED